MYYHFKDNNINTEIQSKINQIIKKEEGIYQMGKIFSEIGKNY